MARRPAGSKGRAVVRDKGSIDRGRAGRQGERSRSWPAGEVDKQPDAGILRGSARMAWRECRLLCAPAFALYLVPHSLAVREVQDAGDCRWSASGGRYWPAVAGLLCFRFGLGIGGNGASVQFSGFGVAGGGCAGGRSGGRRCSSARRRYATPSVATKPRTVRRASSRHAPGFCSISGCPSANASRLPRKARPASDAS